MTLYHYVRNKDELVALVADTILGEIVIPDDELPAGWREGMAEIARRSLAIFRRHPWIIEHLGEGGPSRTGPNLLHHVEQTLAVASRSGLDLDDQFELAAIVDDYVFGFALRAHESGQFGAEGEARRRADPMVAYLTEQLGSGDYPHLEAVAGDDPVAGFARIGHLTSGEQRFERGLQALLGGLELWVGGARGAAARPR
jgi:AcrR family transcriptional regulator